jgi:tRNA threonylcarbamoyladenosine biosynthesis protein TsaB
VNRLLAIDTAGSTAGIAVSVAGELRSEITEASVSRHAQRLFRMIERALEGAEVRREELTVVAVTWGPGSFTGLRVGVAVAKGIAFALGLPAVGVSTLEALAGAHLPFPGVVAPVLDARKNQVYAAAWDGREGGLLLPEGAWNPEEFARRLAGFARPCLLTGSGLGPYAGAFAAPLGERLLAVPPERWAISPGQVAVIADRKAAAGQTEDPARLLPVYHRLSEAEEKKASRLG